MFDVGFSELIVIGIVALVVIGPERLPKVARTAGLLLGRMQRYVNEIKADINREMQLDELKQLKEEMQESARNFESQLSNEMRSLEKSVVQAVQPAIHEDVPAGDAPVVASPERVAPPNTEAKV